MFLVPICCIKHTVSTLFLPCLFHKTPISLINGFYCAPWTVHCAVTCSHFLHFLRIIKAILTPLAISSQYLTNIWPLLLCPTRRKLPLFSTNVHLHPLSLQTFRLSSVPHKNPLRHDYLGRGPINKRHVSELVIFQERLLYNTGESSYHAPTLTLPFCLQVSHCANNWTFVDTQYSMMAGQSI